MAEHTIPADEKSWGLMDEQERVKWLSDSILSLDCSLLPSDKKFASRRGVTLSDEGPVLDANFITACESRLTAEQFELYVRSCLSEASVITYEGMTTEQVQSPEAAKLFYRTLLKLPLEFKAKSMYWAHKGECV